MNDTLKKIPLFLFILLCVTISSCSCGGGGGGSKDSPSLENPDIPGSVLASSDIEGELTVSWTGNNNDGRYSVIIDSNNPMDNSTAKIVATATSPLAVAMDGGDYYVWVVQINSDGSTGATTIANSGSSIEVKAEGWDTPVLIEPDNPTGANVTSSANGQLEVSWTGDSHDGSYRVVVDDDSYFGDDIPLVNRIGASSPTIVNGLSTGTYYAWIVVKDTQGVESIVSVQPYGIAVTNPGTASPDDPAAVVAVTPDMGQIKVTWSGDAKDGSYRVVIDDDYSYDNDTPKFTQTGASSPLEVDSLESGNYYIWVIPVNPDSTEGSAVMANDGAALSVYNGTLNSAGDTWIMYAGMSTTIPTANLLANDANNINDDPLEIVSVKNATNGTVSLDGSMITFTSTGPAGSNATFTYVAQIIDNNLFQVEGVVTITINEKPSLIANSDTATVQQGGEVYISKNSLLSNDVGDDMELTAVFNAVNGTVSMVGDNITFVSTGLAYEPAQFDYKIVDALGTESTGTVFVTVEPLPPIEVYIYEDIEVFDEQKLVYAPPTVQNIFNSWGRFDGNNFFENKEEANANAAAWEFLTDPDRVSMPLNVDPYNGFISLQKVENYTFEATLTSTDNDNDTVGLVIAFVRQDTDGDGILDTNFALSALRTQGGTDPKLGWGVTYGTGETGAKYNDTEWIIEEKEVGPTIGNWGDAGATRIKIVRTGDVIKCYTTKWNNAGVYEATSEIIIDLNSDPRLEKFKGAQSYGYSTFSQPDTTYLDVNFDGGIDANTMMYIDWDTGIVQTWEYEGDQWVITEKTIQEIVGYVRVITNPETGKTYLVKEDSIELIE